MDDQAKNWLDLMNNPLFQQAAIEYFKLAQQQGLEAAKRFWSSNVSAENFSDAQQMFDRMSEFTTAMGFVPLAKYEELKKETEQLRNENQLLRDSIAKLQNTFAAENGAKAQEAWQNMVDKQLELSNEITKNFFEALKQTPKSK